MTTHQKSGNFIELQDLWKISSPPLSFDIPIASTTVVTSTAINNPPKLRRRPTPFPNFAAAIKSPTLPFHPTEPLPSPKKSPFLPPRSSKYPKSRPFKPTKQKTSTAFHRVSNSLHVHFHSRPQLNLLRKMLNAHTQRAEKKGEAKKLAKEEFSRNWDNMTEEEQIAYTKEREESRLREKKRLEDVKKGTAESRRADAKTAAISGAIVVCM